MILNNQQTNAIASKIHQELCSKVNKQNALIRQETDKWFPENWEIQYSEIQQLNELLNKYGNNAYKRFIKPEEYLNDLRFQKYSESKNKASYNLETIKTDVIIASMKSEDVDNLIKIIVEKYTDV